MKYLILLIFLFSSGCSGFVTYTIVSAGTLTGQMAHDAYNEYFNDGTLVKVEYYYDKPDKKTNNKYHSAKKTEKGN